MDAKIKELTDLNDFKKVYTVFSDAPYFEKYTEEELENIFTEYHEKGYIYGAYAKEKCLGLIALEIGLNEEHPVNFQDKKIMYLSDVAVLKEYREKGLGQQLMLYGVMQSKLLGYDRIYMRTLEENSMSYGIASKIGFQQIPNAFQDVEKERMDGTTKTMKNIFLDLNLRLLDREKLSEGIKLALSNPSQSIGDGERDD